MSDPAKKLANTIWERIRSAQHWGDGHQAAYNQLYETLDHYMRYGYKAQFLVDYMDKHGWLEEHCFTFPDGDTFHARTEESRGLSIPEAEGSNPSTRSS